MATGTHTTRGIPLWGASRQGYRNLSDRIHSAIRNLLLGFVLVSIGFVLGKHSAQRSAGPAENASRPTVSPTEAATLPVRVRVYYLHATFRCVTCNTIERMAREVVDQQFSDALADGAVEWQEADFQENEALAKQFDVIASCVVVAKMRGDTVLDFKRLDEVWTLMKDAPRFNAYIGDAIRGYLE